MFQNFVDYGGPHKDQKKICFQNFFPHHSLAKTYLLKNFQQNFRNFFFHLIINKKLQNSVMKNHRYGNTSREKTVTAVWRKISEVIEKSLSEIFKETADQYQVWFPSYNESKKRIFP